jgi:hypothetical protein
MRTLALVSLVSLVAAALSACNSFLGIDNVSLANDGGADPDAPGGDGDGDGDEDAAVDAMMVTETFGFPSAFDETLSLPADLVIGRQISVTAGAWRVIELGFIAQGGGGQVAMGLYTDNGSGAPGQSIGFSDIGMAAVGDNELAATGTFDTATVGTDLWIMLVADAAVPLAGNTGVQVEGCSVGRQFDQMPLPPGSFGVATCAQDDAVNVYVIVTPEG